MYTYEEVLSKIENSRRFGNLPGAEVTRRMLEKLGKTKLSFPFFHIAGTNGKGSTCAFLSSIMREAGVKTGVFTSPHLLEFEERICIDGYMIPGEDVTRLGNFLLEQDFGVTPTMFDYCLVMAVLYFEEQGVELAIFETGLGGRLDSTNSLGNPVASVITRIGFDHMGILGDTLEEIASEKAGIIKPGVPVVIAPQESSVLAVLKKAADSSGAGAVYAVGEKVIGEAETMRPGIPGVHQIENAAAAILAARVFLKCEHAETAIVNGVQKAFWPGRMELLSREPFFMVDGAHNSNGIEALALSLKALYPGERFHFIMAVMADKDYEKMIEVLLPLAIDFVTVTADSERALHADALAAAIRARGIPARSVSGAGEALTVFPEGEKTIALGSLYFIGEIKRIFDNTNYSGRRKL